MFTSVCWNLIIAHYFVWNNLKERQNTKNWVKIAYKQVKSFVLWLISEIFGSKVHTALYLKPRFIEEHYIEGPVCVCICIYIYIYIYYRFHSCDMFFSIILHCDSVPLLHYNSVPYINRLNGYAGWWNGEDSRSQRWRKGERDMPRYRRILNLEYIFNTTSEPIFFQQLTCHLM